jgi:hypothetical protein
MRRNMEVHGPVEPKTVTILSYESSSNLWDEFYSLLLSSCRI